MGYAYLSLQERGRPCPRSPRLPETPRANSTATLKHTQQKAPPKFNRLFFPLHIPL